MSREKFRSVKPGQPITAKRATAEGEVLTRLAGVEGGSGMSGRHCGSFLQFNARPGFFQGIFTITERVNTGTDPPTYLATLRRYNFETGAWTDQEREWRLDPKGMDVETLAVGDRVIAFWDAHRSMLVPIMVSGSDSSLLGIRLIEDHPGKGILMWITLGRWSPAGHGWIYDQGSYRAVDWRHGVPYPEAGATGLAVWRASNQYDRILEIVALDCESPEESSASSSSESSSSGSVSSASSASSLSESSSASESSMSESSMSITSPSSRSTGSSASESSASESSVSEEFSSGSSHSTGSSLETSSQGFSSMFSSYESESSSSGDASSESSSEASSWDTSHFSSESSIEASDPSA